MVSLHHHFNVKFMVSHCSIHHYETCVAEHMNMNMCCYGYGPLNFVFLLVDLAVIYLFTNILPAN